MKQEELALQVKLFNDDEAYKALYQEFIPLIKSMIENLELKYGDFKVSKEDLYQEALLGLYDACLKYETNKYAQFSTFAYIVIKRRINRIFYRDLRRYKKECVSIDNLLSPDHSYVLTNRIAENENNYEIADKVNIIAKSKHITQEDKLIIKMRSENYTYQEIAAKLNTSTKRIDNRLTRLKKLFKEKYHNY